MHARMDTAVQLKRHNGASWMLLLSMYNKGALLTKIFLPLKCNKWQDLPTSCPDPLEVIHLSGYYAREKSFKTYRGVKHIMSELAPPSSSILETL